MEAQPTPTPTHIIVTFRNGCGRPVFYSSGDSTDDLDITKVYGQFLASWYNPTRASRLDGYYLWDSEHTSQTPLFGLLFQTKALAKRFCKENSIVLGTTHFIQFCKVLEE